MLRSPAGGTRGAIEDVAGFAHRRGYFSRRLHGKRDLEDGAEGGAAAAAYDPTAGT